MKKNSGDFMSYDTPKKSFTNLSEDIDYFEKGLKCGLEIHQQLNTQKLFCDCESNFHSNEDYLKPDFVLNRKLRLAKSETGDIDVAASFESKKLRRNQYYGFNDSCCLVELDEEPPHEINRDALLVTLEVASFFNMKILDSVNFMRKIVLDGSNTTGFQRTSLVAVNGVLEEKNVGIQSVCLEEDACKKIRNYVSDSGNPVVVYDLSRLGTPLIELATDPDIKTPKQAKEVAEFIGMVLRSTGKVKRGIGTIRQDVNVSIKNGVRVEIKGAQQLELIPNLVTYEVMRQENLIKIYDELKERHATVGDPIELTTILKETKSKILCTALDNKGVIYALKLNNFAGFLGLEIQPGRRFGTDIAGRVKVLGVKGLFHSDELPNYGITTREVESIKLKLTCGETDGFILIAEQKDKALTAINEVKSFLSDLNLTMDVRQALPDATTSYLRPISGSARMYPETDVPIVALTSELLDSLPEIILLTDQINELKSKFKIRESDIKQLLKIGVNIDEVSTKFINLKPKFLAEFLLDYPKEIKKKHNIDVNVLNFYDEILSKLNSGKINKDNSFDILVSLARGEKVDYSKFKSLSMGEIKAIVEKIIAKNKGAPSKALMGLCMAELRGKADGKLVQKLLKELSD